MTSQRGIASTDAKLVPFAEGGGLPLFIEAQDTALQDDEAAALSWLADHQGAIDTLVTEVGAVVLRNFAIRGTEGFAKFADLYPGSGFDYSAGGSPRSAISGNIYESTHYDAQKPIRLHQEMAYLPHQPKILCFYCNVPAETGGSTTLGEMERFTRIAPEKLMNDISEKGVRYIYNYRAPGSTTGVPALDANHRTWVEAFYTEDKAQVEKACNDMGLGFEWLADGSLSTTCETEGLVTNPATGNKIWYNSIAPLAPAKNNFGEDMIAIVTQLYESNGLQRGVKLSHNNGDELDMEEVEKLYDLMESVSINFTWQARDVMLVDNLTVAHGRTPFTGARDVQVTFLR